MLTETAAVLSKKRVAACAEWPRITLVTAVRNGERYIEETIRSVVNQGYPNLEYIVADGASADGTIDVIRKYEPHLSRWASQPDNGVYEGLNRGYAHSTGEIMGWLNASDLLHTNALFVVGSVFAAFPEVEWITGRPTRFNQAGLTVDIRPPARWSRYRFLAGANQYIQQESTFWRRSLWERAGGYIDASRRDVGDFELWVRFFRYAQLYSVDALIGGYRSHDDAITAAAGTELYQQGCEEIIERELDTLRQSRAIRAFRRVHRAVKRIPKVRGAWQRVVMKSLYRMPGPDWPPIIRDDGRRWFLER